MGRTGNYSGNIAAAFVSMETWVKLRVAGWPATDARTRNYGMSCGWFARREGGWVLTRVWEASVQANPESE